MQDLASQYELFGSIDGSSREALVDALMEVQVASGPLAKSASRRRLQHPQTILDGAFMQARISP
jgi:hypothetical protein